MSTMYDARLVEPMWRQLEAVGVKPLKSGADVKSAVAGAGTTLVVVNSVCGCAAGAARPAVAVALQNDVIPDHLYTVFAGVDLEATETARALMTGVPPSSPSAGLFKDGELVFFLPRAEIEGHHYQDIADRLASAFDEHCTRPGPSVEWNTVLRAFGHEESQ